MRLGESETVLVTGGAGYIGSHLCEALLDQGLVVRALDNLSTGRREFLANCEGNERFKFLKADLLKDPLDKAMKGCAAVFHLAANPDARAALTDTMVDMNLNIQATYATLEAMRKNGVPWMCFTSSSVVYGEASEVPTPEDYTTQEPISLYGATKAACEALLSAYCHTFGLQGVSFRFANVVGGRSTHGVTHDFVQRLGANPRRLEILGRDPGTRKSYFHVKDCISGMLHGLRVAPVPYGVFNLGSEDEITVRELADTVCEAMNLREVEYVWSGGVDGGRGWMGDVREMLLDITRLKTSGWSPRFRSREAIKMAVENLLSP